MRVLLLLLLLLPLLSAPAPAQDFSGTYALQGGAVPITLTLRQDARGRITGTLSGQNAFQIQAQVQGQMFQGYASNSAGRIYIAGQGDPSGALQLVMAEMDASGQPAQQTARQLVATRTGAGGQGSGVSQGSGRGVGAGSAPGASGGIATTAADRQVAQLLLRSPWCHFSYSQTSGTSHTERVVYRPDGTGNQTGGTETYSSGANGTVSGQSANGTAFRWRIQNQMLVVTTDGVTWSQPIPLQVTQNSNGWPIITALGKEYSMCN